MACLLQTVTDKGEWQQEGHYKEKAAQEGGRSRVTNRGCRKHNSAEKLQILAEQQVL